jgi:hypothetical protein
MTRTSRLRYDKSKKSTLNPATPRCTTRSRDRGAASQRARHLAQKGVARADIEWAGGLHHAISARIAAERDSTF